MAPLSGLPDRMDRLVIASVLRAVVIVLAAFLVLDWTLSLLNEMRGRSGAYGFREALLFVVLTSPRRIWELMPFAGLLGALAGLSVLAARSELLVMRSAGRSLWRIVAAAMLPCLMLVLLGVVIAETVAPTTESIAQTRKALARGGEPELRTRAGFWHRDGNRITQALAMDPEGHLIGISQFDLDAEGRLLSWREARRAAPLEALGDGRMRWQLEQVSTQQWRADRWHMTRQEHAVWDSTATVAGLRAAALVAPERLPVSELRQRIAGAADAREQQRHRLALWQRLSQPLGVVVLVLLGSGFLFGPLRERSMGVRLAAGVALGLGFRVMQDLLGPASLVYGLPPVVVVFTPLLLALLAGGLLLRRAAAP